MDINDFFEPQAIEELENADFDKLKKDVSEAMTELAPFLAALFHKWPEANNYIVFPLRHKEGRRLMNIIVHSPDKELPSIADLTDD